MFGLLVNALGMSLNFGGEDPGITDEGTDNWHHEKLTREAAQAMHWSAPAAQELAWHADYVDSYLYNPLWWAGGGLSRLKAVLATRAELKDLHFDDLTDVVRVDQMWRRYTSGTVAGLLWAGQSGDVSAARNIVGAGLHAIQDFYSHSTWIDDVARRGTTWLDMRGAERLSQPIYTGTYEASEAHGIAHHGMISLGCTLLEKVPSPIMDVACHALSPLSNTGVCQVWRSCEDAQAAQPATVRGVPVPPGMLYLSPPGIALDSTWQAPVATELRGLDLDPQQAFALAFQLALSDSIAWLARLDWIMDDAGLSDFWSDVKHRGSSHDREQEFESFERFPYMFLTVGGYPPTPGDGDAWYLRVRVRTGDEAGAGTDATIWLTAGGHRRQLDYFPQAPPPFEHDDFVARDNEVYYVGPCATLPQSLELWNDTADVGDILEEIGRQFLAAFAAAVEGVRDLLLSLVGGHADLVAHNKLVWSPADRTAIQQDPVPFDVVLDGGSEGDYRAFGSIRRVKSGDDTPAGYSNFEVRLDRLHCREESEWDRGSDSDEPLLLGVLVNQASNEVQQWRSTVESDMDVDSGDTWPLDQVFAVESVPDQAGYLSLALQLMEHDDESVGDRAALLDAFAGQLDRDTVPHRRDLLEMVGSLIGPSWKLDEIEVTAFQRGDTVRCGTVLHDRPRRWLGPQEKVSFPLRMVQQARANVALDRPNPQQSVPRYPPDYRWVRCEGYAYQEPGSGPGGEPLLRLSRWFSPSRLDSFSTTEARYQQPERTDIEPDYRVAGNDGTVPEDVAAMRAEGYLVAPSQPQPVGMVPLHRWFSPGRLDNWSTTDPRYTEPLQKSVEPDYRYARLEGWLFDPDLPQPSGTVPIHRWYSPSRKDNVTTSDVRMRPRVRRPVVVEAPDQDG